MNDILKYVAGGLITYGLISFVRNRQQQQAGNGGSDGPAQTPTVDDQGNLSTQQQQTASNQMNGWQYGIYGPEYQTPNWDDV